MLYRRVVLCVLLVFAFVCLGIKCREKTNYLYLTQDEDAPNHSEWASSPHADETSESFRHWDDDAAVSTGCAKCHSKYGFLDFIGEDGTTVGVVDNAAATDSVIDCETCHNNSAQALTSVTFPSGETVSGLGKEAMCMQCHQGRESAVSVDSEIADASPLADDDTVSTDLGFKNVHYAAAGATVYGTVVFGGYEYATYLEGYSGKFAHVSGYDTCAGCHNPHSLEVKVSECGACHTGVNTLAEVADIRMDGSLSDYDGDGDTTEGIKGEIETLKTTLLSAIYDYATQIAGTPIVYGTGYPYFVIDTDGDGVADSDEVNRNNRYNQFTARLLRAAYNYQYAKKDHGAYAHNPKYLIQLLCDSIEDLATQVTVLGTRVRSESGHFDASAEAFRHWDGDGEMRSSCARCHSPNGLEYYIAEGQDTLNDLPLTYSGLTCDACHVGGDYATTAARKYVATVTFPSDIEIDNSSSDPDDSFICMTCHQGRESKASVDARIATASYSFRNVHYMPAGAVLYGGDAEVGYEYTGPTYAAKFAHVGGVTAQCTYCHGGDNADHHFPPTFTSTCAPCHTEVTSGNVEDIRKARATDYDGDGSSTEKLADEVSAIAAGLYTTIQSYASGTTYIVFSSSSYPYWFIDTDMDGVADASECNYGNGYDGWDATLMKACFNYQLYQKEHGAWAHNTEYIIQLLYDSIDDAGGAGTAAALGFNRP